MLAAATPGALMKKLPAALDCLAEHCERHGLRVNYQTGKQRSCCTFLAKIKGN